MAEDVGQAYVGIVPSLKGFSAKLKAELAGELRGIDAPIHQAGTRAGQGFGDRMREGIRSRLAGIGAMLKTGLLVGGAAVAAGLGAITLFGLKSAAALEQTQIGIESLLGSADEAKKFIAELQAFSAKTPFELQGVADASKRILAFGQAVGITRDEVIPTLSVVGDLVSVLGGGQESIDSVLRAFGQISSKGRVQQEELLQLAEALPGFNANLAIAKALGVTVPEAMARITAGGVDAQTAIDALLQGMRDFPGAAGAMEKQSQTLLGVFSTFKDTIAIALSSAFAPVIPEIKQQLSDITPILGVAIGALAPMLGKLLSTALPLVASLVQAIVPIVTPLLDGLKLGLEALTPAFQPLGDALGQIATALAPLLPIIGKVLAEAVLALVPVITALVPHLTELVPALGDILLALVPILPPLGELLALWVQSQVPLTQFIALLASLLANEAVVPLVEALAFAMQGLVDLARPAVEFSDSLDEIWQHIKDLGSGLARVGGGIVSWFQDLPGNILTAIQALPGLLVDSFTNMLSNVAYAVGFGIGSVIRFFIDAPPKVLAALKALPGLVIGLFVEAFTSARDFVIGKFGEIVDAAKALPGKIAEFVTALPGRLKAAFDAIWPKLLEIGSNIINGLKQGVINAAQGLVNAVRGAVDSAIQGAKDGLGISSPSKVFAQIGDDTIAGYVQGVEQSARAASLAQSAALAPAVGASAAVGAAPQTVTVNTNDPIISAVISQIRDKVREQFGGDVLVAFGSAA